MMQNTLNQTTEMMVMMSDSDFDQTGPFELLLILDGKELNISVESHKEYLKLYESLNDLIVNKGIILAL